MIQPEDDLDLALRRLAQRAPGDPALQPYAEALRRLEALRSTPERDAQSALAGRQAFLDHAAAAPVSRPAIFRHTGRSSDGRKELRPMSALAGLLVALALLFGGGGATALAAQDALPTDWLYPVKLATEGLQLGLTTNPSQQVTLLGDWADRRVQEMEQIAQSGAGVPMATALRLQTQLNEALRLAAQLQDPELAPMLQQLQTRLEIQLRTMEQLRIADPTGAALRTAEQAMTQTRAEVQGALEDPATFRVRHGAGRPADAPVQPGVVPGEPPVSTPAAGGQDGGQQTGQGAVPAAGEGTSAPGGYGPGDGTCALCTPRADGTLCPTCTPLLWTTPGPHGNGPGPRGN
jgi:hypothetical protein